MQIHRYFIFYFFVLYIKVYPLCVRAKRAKRAKLKGSDANELKIIVG